MHPVHSDFFISGGTLPSDALSYVEREADRALFEALRRGEFCYVLTSRQMGKSSLMIRTAERLRETGARVVVIDLTAIGPNLTATQWYRGILSLAGQQLGLEAELEGSWRALGELGPVQRLLEVLRQVAAQDEGRPLILFVDEIDALRSLPFGGDEFLAALRECFNRRAQEPEMHRLTFCLLGVASPSDLIRDTRRTPFNIGRRIELRDFTPREASILGVGLALGSPETPSRSRERAQQLLKRVMWWTGGHPYLTQRLCQAVAADPRFHRAQVDRLCRSLFLSSGAREADDNLAFVRERLVRPSGGAGPSLEDTAALLHLYGRVRRNKLVRDEETDARVASLRLSGIVRSDGHRLRVRNRIYHRAFDEDWIALHMPHAELRRQREAYRRGLVRTASLSGAVLSVVSGLAVYAFQNAAVANRLRGETTQLAEERLTALDQARQLLYVTRIQAAWKGVELGDFENAVTYLDQAVPSSGEPDLRGWEWHYLRSRCRPEIAVLPPGGWVQDLTVINQGAAFTTVDAKHQVLQRDLDGFEVRSSWEPEDGRSLGSAYLSPDGRELLRAETVEKKLPFGPKAPWELRLVDLQRGTERVVYRQAGYIRDFKVSWPLRTLALPNGAGTRFHPLDPGRSAATPDALQRASVVALAADAPLMAGLGRDGRVRIWNAKSRRSLGSLQPDGAPISMRFAREGRSLLVRSREWLAAWDTRTLRRERVPLPSKELVYAYSLSPDGRRLAASLKSPGQVFAPGKVRVWDLHRRVEQLPLHGYPGPIMAMAFTPDSSQLITGGFDRKLRVWGVESNSSVKKLTLGPDRRFDLERTDDARLITREMNEVRVWRESDGAPLARWNVSGFGPLLQLPESRIAIAGEDGIVIRHLSDERSPALHSPFNAPVKALTASADGELLACATQGGRGWLWRPATGFSREVKIPGGGIRTLALTPDGRALAVATGDGGVRITSTSSGEPLAPPLSTGAASHMEYSPDGKRLAVAVRGQIRLWNSETRRMQQLNGHHAQLGTIAFSPDNRTILSADGDGVVKLWHTATGQELGLLPTLGLEGGSELAAFTPDGAGIVASGSTGNILVWSAPGRQTLNH
ncbi:MAG: AAA-like domain-containing protein [Actinomycetota bacterium]